MALIEQFETKQTEQNTYILSIHIKHENISQIKLYLILFSITFAQFSIKILFI